MVVTAPLRAIVGVAEFFFPNLSAPKAEFWNVESLFDELVMNSLSSQTRVGNKHRRI